MREYIQSSPDIPEEVLLSYEANREFVSGVLVETEFFHGTGAMCYDESGSVNDAINRILEEGIVPNEERLSNFFGISQSENVCLTRLGSYARVYASLFKSKEQGVEWEYKDRKWWIYMLAKEMIKEAIPSKEFWKKFISRTHLWGKAEINSLTWNKEGKSNRKSYWLYTMLYGKSDIENNFPVVIGVKKGQNIEIECPDLLGFRLFESRSISSINPEYFSHLQVPLTKVEEVKEKLQEIGVDIPVLAIEWCELHDSQIGHMQLINEGKNSF